jgi:hypothetical protein
MSTFEFLYNIDDKIFDHIKTNMAETNAKKLGLDIRAGYRLWVEDNTIVIHKTHDGCLQYYGGFEYVDKAYRREYGDYVFYLDEADRVREALDRYYGIERPEEDEED